MDRKKLIREYKEKKPDMGVYALRSNATGTTYLGWAKDLRAMLNRQSFTLGTGMHDNKALLEDWLENKDSFEMLVLETLEYDEKLPQKDYTDDLKTLLELWLEKTEGGAAI